MEENINDKITEIMTESKGESNVKEILTIIQLILCQSEFLPFNVTQELFNSILIITNSVSKITVNKDGK